MKRLLILGAALTLAAESCYPQSPARLEAGLKTNAWSVLYQGRQIFRYDFDSRQYKPYVAEFSPPDGGNVLRDAPPDHPHHHGLMYAVKVNGLSFWEEISGSGVQRVIRTTAEGGNPAKLHQVIHWLAPQDAFLADTTPATLLIEHRTLLLTVDAATRESALEWSAEFEVGMKTNTIMLTGTGYHGLGIRFLEPPDAAVNYTYAGRVPDLLDRQEVSSARWVAVSFSPKNQTPATIALFPHPTNSRGDGKFFSMRSPFSYLAATQGLDVDPLVYRRGDRFTLRYFVALYPELKSTEALDARARRWHEGSPIDR